MRRFLFRFCFMALAGMICLTLLVVICLAKPQQYQAGSSSMPEDSIRKFLQTYVKKRGYDNDKTTRYTYAVVDLNGDGKNEAIVHLVGLPWCGSGGCPTLVLERTAASYRLITRIFITRLPIRVLTSSSHGWRNLAVWKEGGSPEPGYEAELRFDGKTYPINPSVPPARPLRGKVAGEVVIPKSAKEEPLYP